MLYTIKETEIKKLAKEDQFYRLFLNKGDINLFKFENENLDIYDPGLFLHYLGVGIAAVGRLAWVINPIPFYYSKEKKRLILESYYAKPWHLEQFNKAINKFNELITL